MNRIDKHKYIFLVATVLFLNPLSAIADWFDYDLVVRCEPTQNRVKITPVILWNISGNNKNAECIFSNGKSVRVRMTIGPTYSSGEQGAQPDVWISIWIDRAKVVSRYLVAEREGDRSCNTTTSDHSDCKLYFEVTAKGLSKCKPEREHGQVCDFTFNETLPKDIDYLEFPRPEYQPPALGAIVIEYAQDKKFCEQFLLNTTSYRQDTATSQECPGCPYLLEGSEEIKSRPVHDRQSLRHYLVDIDNDGKDESVYQYSPPSHFRDSTIYFIYKNDKKLDLGSKITVALLEKTSDRIYPHSWTECRGEVKDWILRCPTYDGGQYSFVYMKDDQTGKVPVFDLRYLHMNMLRLKGTTYLTTWSTEPNNKHLRGVLRPEPNGSVTDMCYFNKIRKSY